MPTQLQITDLQVTRDGKEIIHGLTLSVQPGELVALLGPNGSGKSTLVTALMGHPKSVISGGQAHLDGELINDLAPDERARRGLFLSVQHPPEIPGVTVSSFLRAAFSAVSGETVGVADFRVRLIAACDALHMDKAFLGRGLNVGFSGGERKRLEMLQLALLAPKYALLDETDSGLDVDALRIVADGVRAALARGCGVLLITHNPAVLADLAPAQVHVLCNGRIVATGDQTLATKVAKEGYAAAGCEA
jgi:Fe-S cluster assembly ATP-binding protein